MPLAIEQVAKATRCPLANVTQNWPLLMSALDASGTRSDAVEVAIAATIAVETDHTFQPIHEKMANPAKQPDLAARQAKYAPYTGRGFVQITWMENYQAAGKAIGVDLVSNPDMANDPETAAKILVWFFVTHPSLIHNVVTAAVALRWDLVRQRVNGGLGAWDDFIGCVNALLGVPS